jgi:hypothetical protein
MESPEAAKEMAWLMVLQAVSEDLQSLLSLPLTPFTYHVVLAKADGAMAKSSGESSAFLVDSLRFIIFLPLASGNTWRHSRVLLEK